MLRILVLLLAAHSLHSGGVVGSLGLASARAAEAGADLDHLLDAMAGYQSTDSRAALREMEGAVAAAATQPDLRHLMAEKLSARLASTATLDAKKFFCWQLSLIGSDKEVPALAACVADTNMSYYARLALERIPGECCWPRCGRL